MGRRRQDLPDDDAAAAAAGDGLQTLPRASRPPDLEAPTSLRFEGADIVAPPGMMIDHYRLMRRIGHGGMGEVHLARDVKLGRKVALKLVHPKQFDSPETVERFIVEARLTARFNHPHIVTIYGVGEHDGRPYLALEYLEGQDLGARMGERPLSVREAMRIGLAVAEALLEAHAHGVLHRDLKPGNVMIGRDGLVRVLDFGLSKALDTQGPVSVRLPEHPSSQPPPPDEHDSWGFGTPKYLAPEQWREEECTTATDLWAFGTLLYSMLGHQLPFDENLLRDQAYIVCTEPAPPIDGLVRLSAELSALVHRCLEKTPSDRPSAAEVVEQLSALIGAGGPRRWGTKHSPFRGLMPFTAEHADRFFGRDDEIASFVERTRLQPVLPVLGPSGAGKSSFVRAGAIPRLEEQESWIVMTMRPGSRPFHSLALRLLRGDADATLSSSQLLRRSLTSPSEPTAEPAAEPVDRPVAVTEAVEAPETIDESVRDESEVPTKLDLDKLGTGDQDVQRVAELLRERPARLGFELRALSEERRCRVLIFVDQLEELFTLAEDPTAAEPFLEAICGATDDALDPVRVIFTLRDDYLGRVATGPLMREVLSQVTVIQRPDVGALHEILIRPIEQLGFHYEDRELVDEMVEAVGGEPACLPLLQFAASQLWERRDRDGKLLLRSAYAEMGGVEGALAGHADGVLATLSADDLPLARNLLLRMVTPQRSRRVVSRRRVLEGLDKAAREILARLTEARLVTASKIVGDHGVETLLELAHESLIRRWSTLSRWLDESREELVFLAEAGQVAELWIKRGRRRSELWEGDALHECLRNMARVTTEVPTPVREFVEASGSKQRQRTFRRRAAFVGGFVAMAAIAVGAILLALFVREQRDMARHDRADALREGGRAALAQGNVLEARAKLRLALESQDSVTARALWWQLRDQPIVWRAHVASTTFGVAISPDARQVAASSQDGPVYLFDTTTRATRILRGHGDQAIGVAFSPDGKLLASGSLDKTVRLWDCATGELVRTLEGHGSAVHGVAFSPDGKRVAAGAYDTTVRVFDVDSGKLEMTLKGHEAAVRGVAFNHDGTLLASAGTDRTARLWNVESGKARAVLRGHDREVYGVAFSPDGTLLATGSYDGTLRVWDVAAAKSLRVLRGHGAGVSLISFSSDGTTVASAGGDRTARLWDAQTGRELRRLEHGAQVTAVAFGPEGKLLAAATGAGVVALWDLEREPSVSRAGGHGKAVSGVSLSPDGRSLASAGFDKRVLLWDVQTGDLLRALEGHQDAVGDVAFSPDGSLIASGSKDGTIRLWDPTSGETTAVLTGHRADIYNLSFSPDGKLLASGSYDQTARLWNVSEGVQQAVLEGHGDRVRGVAFSPDGKVVASSGYDKTIRLWDVDTGAPKAVLRGHEHRVYGVSFSPDGTQLASGSYDETLRLWDLDDDQGRVLGRHPGRIYSLAFHPDGAHIGAPGSDGTARIWDVKTGEYVVLRGHRNEVNKIVFDGAGALAATASDDGTVRVWDAKSGRPFWRAPALVVLGAKSMVYTHRGWLSLDATPADPPAGAWRSAVELRARDASQSPDRKLLCIETRSAGVELFDLESGEQLFSRGLPGLLGVRAVDSGCLARDQDKAVLLSRDGSVIPLPSDGPPGALGWGPGRLLVEAVGHLLIFDSTGKLVNDLAVGVGVTAVTLHEGWLLLGYGDGNIDLRPVGTQAERPGFTFEQTAASPVETIIPGPSGTLIAGYGNGLLGIWDRESGARLAQATLHGPITHLRLVGRELHVATDLGHFMTWDLATFYVEHCELLRQVWQQIPVVWSAGHPVLQPPPADHHCQPR